MRTTTFTPTSTPTSTTDSAPTSTTAAKPGSFSTLTENTAIGLNKYFEILHKKRTEIEKTSETIEFFDKIEILLNLSRDVEKSLYILTDIPEDFSKFNTEEIRTVYDVLEYSVDYSSVGPKINDEIIRKGQKLASLKKQFSDIALSFEYAQFYVFEEVFSLLLKWDGNFQSGNYNRQLSEALTEAIDHATNFIRAATLFTSGYQKRLIISFDVRRAFHGLCSVKDITYDDDKREEFLSDISSLLNKLELAVNLSDTSFSNNMSTDLDNLSTALSKIAISIRRMIHKTVVEVDKNEKRFVIV